MPDSPIAALTLSAAPRASLTAISKPLWAVKNKIQDAAPIPSDSNDPNVWITTQRALGYSYLQKMITQSRQAQLHLPTASAFATRHPVIDSSPDAVSAQAAPSLGTAVNDPFFGRGVSARSIAHLQEQYTLLLRPS